MTQMPESQLSESQIPQTQTLQAQSPESPPESAIAGPIVDPTEKDPTEKKREARGYIVFAFAIAVVLAALWFARDVVLLIYASALFAVVCTPMVRGVQRLRIRGWSPRYGTAIGLLIFVVVAALAMFCTFALPPVLRDLQSLAHEAPQRVPAFAASIHRLPFLRDQSNLDLNGRLQGMASAVAGFVFSSLPSAANVLGRFLMGIILTIYFMLEGPEAYQWALSFVPLRNRVRLDAALQRAEVRMGKWLLAQGTLMLILGVCSFVVFAALHLRYYTALALLMGLFNLIPFAGAIITVVLAMLVAALDSWGKVAGVMIFYAFYAQLENGYLTPRIMKNSVDLAGLAVIVALLIGGKFGGILGAVIAVPSAVLVAVLLDEYFVHHDRHGAEPVLTSSALRD